MTGWTVTLEDGKRVYFSSKERADAFARDYEELHGEAVREEERHEHQPRDNQR